MDATTPQLIHRVADHIDRQGIELLPTELLTAFVAAARAAAASEVLIAVLVDPTEPTVARERAAVKLTSRILSDHPAPAISAGHSIVLAA